MLHFYSLLQNSKKAVSGCFVVGSGNFDGDTLAGNCELWPFYNVERCERLAPGSYGKKVSVATDGAV